MNASKHILRFIIYGTFCCLMIAATACKRNEGSVNNSPVTIHLFKNENPAISFPIDKDDENGWKPLLDIDLSQSDYIIYEHDIIKYNWSLQKITLSGDLKTHFEYNKYGTLDYDYFILALGEKPIVGGIILPMFSAVGARIPVLYVSNFFTCKLIQLMITRK